MALKMPFLLPLLALLLLSTAPTVTEVVTSMSACNAYFLNQKTPQISGILEGGNILDQNRYKPICQTLDNKRTFVSLYDTTNKIPVFSAYKYTGNEPKRPIDIWMIEPQLDEINPEEKNMKLEEDGKSYTHQAVFTDYSNSPVFSKGHLLPSSYGSNENDKKSTYALTNIVPQVKSFNTGSWTNMESCVKCVLDKYCINNNDQTEGFVVIGARPGNNILKNKVNIPSMLWSAFCCYSKSQEMWLAGAHWGDNTEEDGGRVLQTKTLAELHQELGGKSEAFPGKDCPLLKSVTNLYPKLKKVCMCPKPISTNSAPPTTASTPPVSTSAILPTTSGSPTMSLYVPMSFMALLQHLLHLVPQ